MTEKTLMLRAADLKHSYSRVSILEGVSLDVHAGRVTALIGPNGSGKTTLIRSLAGLHAPTSGTVAYEGPDTVRRIGYLPQRPAFRPGQSVRNTLAFYASLVGETGTDAMTHLERVGLADAAERDVDALSGGMTRLVGLAQATIGSPPVVILDEPASGLDPGMSVRIFEVVEELAADGTAILLSSHDLSLVQRTVDEVVLLDEGEIVRNGPPDTICKTLGVDSLLEAFEASVAAEAGTVRVQGETA